MTSRPIEFVKGHGTGNDFILLPNVDAALTVSARQVAALCDRRRGLGADGVLVVARTEHEPEVAHIAGQAPYFMDYRNADGSVAEMCGNGARVFVAHLAETGLLTAGDGAIATRGGVRQFRVDPVGTAISVTMGAPALMDRDDLSVQADGSQQLPALGVHMPNPHAVAWVLDTREAGQLLEAPAVTPPGAFPDGVNVEFVRALGADHIEMRVFERGVGETLSCGTGACAAVVATEVRAGRAAVGQRVQVDLPGGRVTVLWRADGEVELSGPAVLVARGTVDADWWAEHA